MPQEFQVITLRNITADFLGKPLSQISQSANLVSGSIEPEPIEAEGMTINVGLEGSATLNIINDDGGDADNVIGNQTETAEDTTMGPQIPFQPGKAWTRYSLMANLKAGASGQPENVAIGVDGNFTFSLGSYRIHDANQLIENAVASDLGHFLLVVSKQDVLALKSNEALTMIKNGSLKASASFSWANVLTTGLGKLTRLLRAGNLLVLQVDQALKVSASIKIDDDFKLVFSRKQQKYFLGLSKANQKATQFSLQATVDAGLQNPGDLEQAANALINGLYADLDIPKIEKILNQATEANLNQLEQKLITDLYNRLGLSGPVSKIAAFRERFLGLQAEIGGFLDQIISKVNTAGGDAQAQVDQALAQVNQVLFENAAMTTIEKINQTLNFNDLNDGEKFLVNKVLQALSLDAPLQDGRDLVNRILEIEQKAADAINQAAGKITDQIQTVQSEIDTAVEKVRTLLLGNEYVTEVNRLLSLASKESLIQMGTQELDKLLDKVGLKRLLTVIGRVRDRWQAFNDKVQAAITKVAQIHAQAAYSFEYHRTTSSGQLLEMSFTAAALETGPYHEQALKMDLDPLLATAHADASGVTLRNFIAETSKQTSFHYGFALNIGKWSIYGRDKSERKLQTRVNQDGKQMVSFTGLRDYDGRSLFQNDFSWAVNLSAQTETWSKSSKASLGELSYALWLTFDWQVGKLGNDDISRFIDQAILWGALPEQSTAATEEIGTRLHALRHKSKITFTSQLLFDNTGFSKILPGLANPDTQAYGMALGAAMPWNSVVSAVQPHLAKRRALYGPLWNNYLDENRAAINNPERLEALSRGAYWGRAAAQAIEATGDPQSLAVMEQNTQLNRDLWLMSGMVDTNPATFTQWQSMVAAMNALAQGIVGHGDALLIEGIFRKCEPLFAQSHQVRALGAYLLQLSKNTGVSRVLNVAYTDSAGTPQVIVLS